jgi:hypothetical protein
MMFKHLVDFVDKLQMVSNVRMSGVCGMWKLYSESENLILK